MRAKINLRCDAKAARALSQRQGWSQAYTTRESEVLVRARSRQSERSRSVESGDRNEPGRILGTKHLPSLRLEFLKSLMGKSSENAMTFRSDTAEQFDGSDENSDDVQYG